MKISKYHGLGNDFIITRYDSKYDYSKLATKLCEEHVSIGADGFIVLKENPLEMVFYNKDGSLAPMCGNGIRCLCHYILRNNITNSKKFDIKTLAGIMKVDVVSDKDNDFRVKINMGSPIFDNESFKAASKESYFPMNISFENSNYDIYSLFMGTIHTVVLVDDAIKMCDSSLGEYLCNNPLFKEKTNVNFISRIDEENYIIRTYERGVGFTYACGTGACAAFVVLNKLKKVGNCCNMHLKYGILKISKDNDSIFMDGPSCHVFDTEIEDDIYEI